LTPQEVSLEEAFMELTQDSVEFHAGAGPPTRCRPVWGEVGRWLRRFCKYRRPSSVLHRRRLPARHLRECFSVGVDQDQDAALYIFHAGGDRGLRGGAGALISYESSVHFGPGNGTWDPTSTSLSGLVIGQLTIAVLGVLAITSEYSTGMIRTSLAAVPAGAGCWPPRPPCSAPWRW